ncbi:MAG: hypothetical protein J6R01_08135 [Alistipes sp.]|nr:hypothetical protein [Alistipes sp.]
MAQQELIRMNGIAIRQPDEGLGYDFETTYTEDTKRSQSGSLHASAMFTVEAFSYEASFLTFAEATQILEIVAKGGTFTLRYPSLYYGRWRDGKFYVGKGSLKIGRINTDDETVDSLSFNMIGVEPI